MEFSALSKGLGPNCHREKATVNSFGRGAVLKLAPCNRRLFQIPSRNDQIDLLAFCWPDYSYEENPGCWEQVLPNGDTVKKISYFLLRAPH